MLARWCILAFAAIVITLPVTIVRCQLNTFSDHYYSTREKSGNGNSNGNGNLNPSQSPEQESDRKYNNNYNNGRQPYDYRNNAGGQYYGSIDYGRTNPLEYFANGTHRIFGNVSEFYSPNVYGRANPANPTNGGGNPNLRGGANSNYDSRQRNHVSGSGSSVQDAQSRGYENYGRSGQNQNSGPRQTDNNVDILDNERRDSDRSATLNSPSSYNNGGSVKYLYPSGGNPPQQNQQRSQQQPGQFSGNRDSPDNRDKANDPTQQGDPLIPDILWSAVDPAIKDIRDKTYNYDPRSSYNDNQDTLHNRGKVDNPLVSDKRGSSNVNIPIPGHGNTDFQGNAGYQGRPGYEGSHGFGPGGVAPRPQNPVGAGSKERDQQSSSVTQNPFTQYQQTNRPYPEMPFYGSNQQTGYRGAEGSYNSRGVFDPGYPNRNIWNEHWSTTTLRPTAPGVLGKWRPDLQGQQRPEELHRVPQTVYATTNYGRVQGFKVKLYDGPWVPLPARPGIVNVDKVKTTVSSFVGIPYARSPAREGRFRPPRPHTGWQLHQAVEFGPACPQPSRFFGYQEGLTLVDEDCLYLNVYSPDVSSGVEGSSYPVIFYIHDGDFIHGGSQTFPPHQLVGWYKLVVVTVNFRLGALGFISTGDEYSPGNYGMLDLSLALKWVHENIRAFNGDPNRISLMGIGSGAAAAGLLMLVPRTKSYVKNVIALDGAPTAEWAAINDQNRLQNTTQLYSFKMGCWNEYDTTSWSMIECLKTRSWQELANLELEPDVGYFPWSPAVDRTFTVPKDDYEHDWTEESYRFLPDTPENILKSGSYPQIRYMTSFSRQSAADLLYNNKSLSPNYEVTREWFDEQINLWVKRYNYTLNPEGVYNAIRYAYTYWPDPLNTTWIREEYINFLSDALYRAPVDQTIKLLLARGVQVHTMLLNYTLEGLRLPQWREVNRGLQYYMLSGAPFMDPEFFPERLRLDRSTWTEGDRNMSLFLMTAVANMSYYGNPTHEEILGLYWQRSMPAEIKYFSLNGTNNSTMDRNYRQRELTFWSEYMPYVVGKFVPTYPPTTEYWWEPNEPLQIAFWTVSGICLILIVILVSCCLLWRNAKMQRDRIYDDLGLRSIPNIGTIVGDEISEYAETVKTIDSMDSTLKIPPHSTNPQIDMRLLQPQIQINQGAISQPSLAPSRDRDRFPTPRRTATPQTQSELSAAQELSAATKNSL